MERFLSRCPICHEALHVTELACRHCETSFRGAFARCAFCGLPAEHREFVELFLRHRGNLSSVGSELGLSYPTVAKRLDAALSALGIGGPEGAFAAAPAESAAVGRVPAGTSEGGAAPPNGKDAARRTILEMLDRGEIDADEATRRLSEL